MLLNENSEHAEYREGTLRPIAMTYRCARSGDAALSRLKQGFDSLGSANKIKYFLNL
jgi:hypothetical protein